jgi:hypothetical protein
MATEGPQIDIGETERFLKKQQKISENEFDVASMQHR